jgi:hypothetical protein
VTDRYEAMVGWVDIPFLDARYDPYADALLALIAVWVVIRVAGRIRRRRRSKRPAQLHPRLQKYGIDYEEAARERRALAAGVVATSSSDRLVGYEIVQQVEAVFVEGFRTPGEAIEALKAAAVERGANALINVGQERTAAGKCRASGDAVRVKGPPAQPEPKEETDDDA